MLSYLQKPGVQITLFIVAVAVGGGFFWYQSQQRTAPKAAPKPPPAGMGQASTEQVDVGRRELTGSEVAESNRLDKLVLPPLRPEQPTVIVQKEEPKRQEQPKKPAFPELVQVQSSPSMKPFSAHPPKVFAPRGTLIKAALVITLETNNNGTPVLGMVTEDVYFQGNLIVPAGTQVMAASAQDSKIRDRVDIRGAFTFIWTDGSEYVINGIALDHQPLPDGTFGLLDGSPGIRGRIMKSDEYIELKILVSEALQGIMRSQQDQFQSIYGLVPTNSSKNAALGAGTGGASAYSNLLVQKMENDTNYVQVPAGTSFYIYTLDVFEPELRSIGGLRQGNTPVSGVQLQQSAYSQMAAAAAQKAAEFQAELAGRKVATEEQAAAERHEALVERTKALMVPTSGAPAGSPGGGGGASSPQPSRLPFGTPPAAR
jgi:hypothetical protein